MIELPEELNALSQIYRKYTEPEDEEEFTQSKKDKNTRRSAATTMALGTLHKPQKRDSSKLSLPPTISAEEYRKTCNISERSTASLVYEVETSVNCSAKANIGSQVSCNEEASPFPSNWDLDECEEGHFRTRDAQVFELDDWCQEDILDENLVLKNPLESCTDKSETHLHQKSGEEPQQFRLLYIPATFTKKHIVAKLETFGPLRSFEFVTLPDPSSKKVSNVKHQFVSNPKLAGFKGYLSQQPQGKVEEFKGAIFTFEDEAAETKFSEIKRLRVKGLQIKVLTQPSAKDKPAKSVVVRGKKTTPQSQRETEEMLLQEQPEHCCRPTTKRYWAQKDRQSALQEHMSSERNYGFNFRQTEEQFLFVHI